MARTNNAKPAVAKAATAKPAVTAVADTKTQESHEEVKHAVEATLSQEPVVQNASKKTISTNIDKEEEVEVVALIPNVSYKDSHTGDLYSWEEVGQVELLPFDVVQRMWQQSKSYFKDMWLKPLDERVIKKFGLESTYKKYDFLMNESNYTKDNVDSIVEAIVSTPAALKFTLCNKVKSLVSTERVTDIGVIRALERNLRIDLLGLVR